MLGASAGRGGFGWTLALAGVLLMSGAVIFSLVTLPVELNASARARDMLARNGLVTAQEAQGVSSMLNAAALTYIAAAAQSVMQLLYFVTLQLDTALSAPKMASGSIFYLDTALE